MELNSSTVTINKSAADVCTYLGDVKNFKEIMPENISKFELIRENAFVFALNGMPEIALEIKEIDSPSLVRLGAISDKIPFNLTANVEAIDDNTSEVELVFTGKFNMMMAMMVKGPVSKFIETLATNLTKV